MLATTSTKSAFIYFTRRWNPQSLRSWWRSILLTHVTTTIPIDHGAVVTWQESPNLAATGLRGVGLMPGHGSRLKFISWFFPMLHTSFKFVSKSHNFCWESTCVMLQGFLVVSYKFEFLRFSDVVHVLPRCNQGIWILLQNHTLDVVRFLGVCYRFMCFLWFYEYVYDLFKMLQTHIFLIAYDFFCNRWFFFCWR